uniref:Sulfotransfer_1 domain-containing protein n=1 Tax=Macrostomum lignano TaxID=282301 RepID=A0A1I8FQG0_9PLAT
MRNHPWCKRSCPVWCWTRSGLERTLKLRSPFIDLNLPPELPVPRPIDGAKKLDRPRVLKTHLCRLPFICGIWRDELSEFSQFWRMMLGIPGGAENTEIVVHDFFDFNLSWWSMRRHSRVLILFYEDLIVDKTAEVKRMAEFLSTPLTRSPAALGATADQLLRNAVQPDGEHHADRSRARWRPGSNFIRRGEIGDWKRHFSAEDAELVDGIIEEKLAGSGLQFRLRVNVNSI